MVNALDYVYHIPCPSKFLHQPLSTMGAKHSRPSSPSEGSTQKRASRLDLVKPSFMSYSKNKGKESDASATAVPSGDSTKGDKSATEREETNYSTPIYETTGQTIVSRTVCGCANTDKHSRKLVFYFMQQPPLPPHSQQSMPVTVPCQVLVLSF